jgi:hypothetical protein
MVKFLNDYAAAMNRAPQEKLDKLRKAFERTIALVDEALGVRAFRPVRSLNAAVFDAVMVAIASRLSASDKLTADAVANAYDRLLTSTDFVGWERSTSNEENVRSRIESAIKVFSAA